jgi:uncharacterized protein (DUF3820 family)
MIMPFGKHKGLDMEDVPASYLMWLYGNDVTGEVHDYIVKNMQGIKKQIEDGRGDV